MTVTSKTILFFGTEDFSAYTLEALIARGFTIGAIITKPDTRRGRGKQLVAPRVKTIGLTHNIPVWQPARLSDIAHQIAAFDQPLGILVSFGKIIPQSIIDLFNPGIINLHPSLLPHYRGPSPIETAILHGDTHTGISIMQLSAAMDAGPVYLRQQYPLNGKETAPELYKSLGQLGADLLVGCLPQIIDGTLPAVPQEETAATYCQLIRKTDGIIAWDQETAEQIERKIRAYADWPQCRAAIGELNVIITEAHALPGGSGAPGTYKIESDSSLLVVNTRTDSLRIDRIKPLGKKEMPIRAFLAGYKDKLS